MTRVVGQSGNCGLDAHMRFPYLLLTVMCPFTTSHAASPAASHDGALDFDRMDTRPACFLDRLADVAAQIVKDEARTQVAYEKFP